MIRRGKNVAVVGQGDAAAQLVAALGALQGVAQVRQVAVELVRPRAYDVVVEAVGGVALAYEVAMGALSQGVDCVVTSPFLLAAHGEVLSAAARGQGAKLGVTAAGFGVPVMPMVRALAVERLVMGLGAGNVLLNRMRARQENCQQAERQLELQGSDLSDAGGKVSYARAVVLAGEWQGVWHNGKRANVQRGSVDRVDAMVMRHLRGMGLELVLAAQIDRVGVYAGPMAVPIGSALADGVLVGENVVVMVHGSGEAVIRLAADDRAMVRSGVVADVENMVRGLRYEVPMGEVEGGDGIERCVVRCVYGKREAVMQAGEVIFERVEGDGMWQAVVQGVPFARLRMLVPEALVLPLVGGWDVPAAGLRLVG